MTHNYVNFMRVMIYSICGYEYVKLLIYVDTPGTGKCCDFVYILVVNTIGRAPFSRTMKFGNTLLHEVWYFYN